MDDFFLVLFMKWSFFVLFFIFKSVIFYASRLFGCLKGYMFSQQIREFKNLGFNASYIWAKFCVYLLRDLVISRLLNGVSLFYLKVIPLFGFNFANCILFSLQLVIFMVTFMWWFDDLNFILYCNYDFNYSNLGCNLGRNLVSIFYMEGNENPGGGGGLDNTQDVEGSQSWSSWFSAHKKAIIVGLIVVTAVVIVGSFIVNDNTGGFDNGLGRVNGDQSTFNNNQGVMNNNIQPVNVNNNNNVEGLRLLLPGVNEQLNDDRPLIITRHTTSARFWRQVLSFRIL